jgi:hypothetical protein
MQSIWAIPTLAEFLASDKTSFIASRMKFLSVEPTNRSTLFFWNYSNSRSCPGRAGSNKEIFDHEPEN